ncbi:MAG: hypothetical protein QOJ10_972 [Chloroflexota bacterium]|nr:hypothetical protein [Chloroflexota bacterium]
MVLVKPFGGFVHFGDPQHDLRTALARRPVDDGADKRTAYAPAPKTGIDPQRGQRDGAGKLSGTSAHSACHLAFHVGDETSPLDKAAPPAFLIRRDLELVGRAECVRRLLQRGEPNPSEELPVLGLESPDAQIWRRLSCRERTP